MRCFSWRGSSWFGEMRVLHWWSRLVTDDDGQCCWIEALERGLDDPTMFYLFVFSSGPSSFHCTALTLLGAPADAKISVRWSPDEEHRYTITRRLRAGLMMCALVPNVHRQISCQNSFLKHLEGLVRVPPIHFPEFETPKKIFSITYC